MRWFVNSMIVSAGHDPNQHHRVTLAAYSLTRFRYWGRTVVPYFSLLGYMVPSIIFVFPLFLVMVPLDLTDSLVEPGARLRLHHPALLHVADVGLYALHPIEIEEAALIDGASRLQVFSQVVLPTALPGIIAAAIFSLIVSWNDYLFGRVFMNSSIT